MHANWTTGLLFALAAFRACAYLRHRELADLLAASGFVLLACGGCRRVDSDVLTRPGVSSVIAYAAGAGLVVVAVVLMLVAGG